MSEGPLFGFLSRDRNCDLTIFYAVSRIIFCFWNLLRGAEADGGVVVQADDPTDLAID